MTRDKNVILLLSRQLCSEEEMLRPGCAIQAVRRAGGRSAQSGPVPGTAGWREGTRQPERAGPHRSRDPAVEEQRRAGQDEWREGQSPGSETNKVNAWTSLENSILLKEACFVNAKSFLENSILLDKAGFQKAPSVHKFCTLTLLSIFRSRRITVYTHSR